MPSQLQDAVDAGFEEFGKPATYTPPNPPGGAAVPCIVVENAEDREFSFGSGRPFAEGVLLDVRASEVASPAKDGVIALTDGSNQSFTILADPQTLDPERLIWTCRVKLQ